VQGAFLSSEWATLLASKVLNGRTAEDRELLPAILRNWDLDITAIKLADGAQLWEAVVTRVWPCRNDYVHKGASANSEDAALGIDCLTRLVDDVVNQVAHRLGFTREQSGSWSVIVRKNPPEFPDLNPPHRYEQLNPFQQ